jgi:hypothetical protein
MLTDLQKKTAEAIVNIFETGAALRFVKSASQGVGGLPQPVKGTLCRPLRNAHFSLSCAPASPEIAGLLFWEHPRRLSAFQTPAFAPRIPNTGTKPLGNQASFN